MARAVVALLATAIAFIGTVLVYTAARILGFLSLADGAALILPLTAAWVAVALTQHLMRRAGE